MAHIEFSVGLPGIRGPLAFSPATTKPLCDLAEVLLHGPHTLTAAEREMIATYVSSQNDCYYCQTCHGSTAAQHLGGRTADYQLIDQVKHNYQATPLSDKMKALLAIAGKVQVGGKQVTTEDVERARRHGATDKEIHDTVLIAAAFCMFNRYVVWLGPPGSRATPRSIARSEDSTHGSYAGPDWSRSRKRQPLATTTTK